MTSTPEDIQKTHESNESHESVPEDNSEYVSEAIKQLSLSFSEDSHVQGIKNAIDSITIESSIDNDNTNTYCAKVSNYVKECVSKCTDITSDIDRKLAYVLTMSDMLSNIINGITDLEKIDIQHVRNYVINLFVNPHIYPISDSVSDWKENKLKYIAHFIDLISQKLNSCCITKVTNGSTNYVCKFNITTNGLTIIDTINNPTNFIMANSTNDTTSANSTNNTNANSTNNTTSANSTNNTNANSTNNTTSANSTNNTNVITYTLEFIKNTVQVCKNDKCKTKFNICNSKYPPVFTELEQIEGGSKNKKAKYPYESFKLNGKEPGIKYVKHTTYDYNDECRVLSFPVCNMRCIFRAAIVSFNDMQGNNKTAPGYIVEYIYNDNVQLEKYEQIGYAPYKNILISFYNNGKYDPKIIDTIISNCTKENIKIAKSIYMNTSRFKDCLVKDSDLHLFSNVIPMVMDNDKIVKLVYNNCKQPLNLPWTVHDYYLIMPNTSFDKYIQLKFRDPLYSNDAIFKILMQELDDYRDKHENNPDEAIHNIILYKFYPNANKYAQCTITDVLYDLYTGYKYTTVPIYECNYEDLCRPFGLNHEPDMEFVKKFEAGINSVKFKNKLFATADSDGNNHYIDILDNFRIHDDKIYRSNSIESIRNYYYRHANDKVDKHYTANYLYFMWFYHNIFRSEYVVPSENPTIIIDIATEIMNTVNKENKVIKLPNCSTFKIDGVQIIKEGNEYKKGDNVIDYNTVIAEYAQRLSNIFFNRFSIEYTPNSTNKKEIEHNKRCADRFNECLKDAEKTVDFDTFINSVKDIKFNNVRLNYIEEFAKYFQQQLDRLIDQDKYSANYVECAKKANMLSAKSPTIDISSLLPFANHLKRDQSTRSVKISDSFFFNLYDV